MCKERMFEQRFKQPIGVYFERMCAWSHYNDNNELYQAARWEGEERVLKRAAQFCVKA